MQEGRVDSVQVKQLTKLMKDRYLDDRAYQRIKIEQFCKIVQVFGRLNEIDSNF